MRIIHMTDIVFRDIRANSPTDALSIILITTNIWDIPMSITIETDLKEILDKLDQKMDRQFDKLEQKVDRMQQDITELKLGQTKIE